MSEVVHPLVRTARRDVAKLATERRALLANAGRTGLVDHAPLAELDRRIAELIDGVAGFVDPCDASETEPLLLLPVRLETRFAKSGQQTTLRVRIYPDEIHVDDLVRGVTEAEAIAATSYWTAAWRDPVPESAWADFVATVSPDRAEWVAHVHTPNNLAERGMGTPPNFPKVDARGVRNVVARALPDRFVVLARSGNTVSRAIGRPVPRDLTLSPIPLDGDDPARVANALTVAPGSEWLVDYDRAVEAGMAVTVTLSSGSAPLDRVVAIGTRGTLGAAASADEFEDLLVGHRFGVGLGWLGQGTPTNNSDRERSPYQRRRSPSPPPLTSVMPVAGDDTTLAAELIGVDPVVLTGLLGTGPGEQAIAGDVNASLWAPGWGEFLSRLDSQGVPGVVDAQRESARRLFGDHVRGRGPVPALRVGAQPYGVLPVSDLAKWTPQSGETTAGIASVVRTLLERWRVAARLNVPQVRSGGAGIDETLLDVLGSSPVMQGLRVRPVVSDDVSATVLSALGIDHREYEAEKMSTIAIMATLLGVDAVKAVQGSLHRETRPLPLPLASERDPEFITALLGSPSKTLAVDSVLQALLALAIDSGDLDVAKSAPATVVPAVVELATLSPELKVVAASLAARADVAAPHELFGLVQRMERGGVTVGGPSLLRSFEPIEQLQTSLAEVALIAPATEETRLVASASLAGWFRAMGYRNEVRAAVKRLAGTDVAARTLAVAEALDCSSHRLDAWATATVTERRSLGAERSKLRSGTARGLTIGAYGAVEDLRPQTGPGGDGWIHAPSTRHAIAAGMLRSSHLSHLPTSGPATDGGPFAIDLSSGRMQAAAHVIEGVRQGQPLGALIGYQIERGLAEARLARLQLSLRTIAPLVARRLHDADGADPIPAKESIAANNVVDGVLLLTRHAPGDNTLRAALDKAPENVYLDPGDWTALTNAEWNTVTRIMVAAADTIDAVADVMLSEAVLQFAGGNAQRAAAAMDAMATGASPADTLDILEAHDSGERLTHRVIAMVGGGAASGWNSTRPRARVEPSLEAWAAAHLGDPAQVVVAADGAVFITLDQIGFSALDVVFATDLAAFERALIAAEPLLADHTLAVIRDPAWATNQRAIGQVMSLAATLRSLIAGSHPLFPSDMFRPGESVEVDTSFAASDLISRCGDLAGALSAAVAASLGAIASIPADGIVEGDDERAVVAQAAEVLEPFGILLAPIAGRPLDVSWARSAWQLAETRADNAHVAMSTLNEFDTSGPLAPIVEAAQEVVAGIYGDGFVVVPRFEQVPTSFVEAVDRPAFALPDRTTVRRLVRDLSTVRRQMTRLSEALLLEGALGHRRDLRVAQLAGDDDGVPAAGTTHWLAGPLPPEGPWPRSPVAHLFLDVVGSIDTTNPIGGLVIDAWVEDLPGQVGPNADPLDPRPDRARTGLALRCNSASARPPQSILCAVSPDGKRWTADALLGVVEQTLDLARARMVTLERLAGEALVLPALYTRSASLQGQKYLEFTKLAASSLDYVSMPFVKETLS